MQLKSLITIAQNIIKIQPVWCSTYGTEDLNPHSIFVDRVTYCALCTGISCRYLAVALVTWGRALGQSIRRSGQYWSSLKKAGQPTAEGFIPVHPVGHTEATSIHLKLKKILSKYRLKNLVKNTTHRHGKFLIGNLEHNNIIFMIFHNRPSNVCVRSEEDFHLSHFLPILEVCVRV